MSGYRLHFHIGQQLNIRHCILEDNLRPWFVGGCDFYMRNNQWLLFRLDEIWRTHFPDVEQTNPVTISFGRSALYRFGSIRLNFSTGKSQILINGRFRDESFPQEVVDHTIAHELVHYTQGFSSPNPRMHRYPHRGGVIDKELKDRGLTHLVQFYKKWVKDYLKKLP